MRTREDSVAQAAPVFVGREQELAQLVAGYQSALEGYGRLFLLSGEPGIGKTGIADALAREARDRGATVLWGRCWEAGGAPAYWPWLQAFRSLIRDLDPDAVHELLGAGGAYVAQILPELREIVPHGKSLPTLDPASARFRLFEETTALVKRAARERPLVFILDDLHVADTPSLLLLRFLARELTDARVLLVTAYRDTELDRGHPLTATVADLMRVPATQRLRLGGIDHAAVARFIQLTTGVEPFPGLVTLVHTETEGNPLFVGEVVRLLASEGLLERHPDAMSFRLAVPEGVRDTILRRLARLSEHANDVLAAASVLGREFDLKTLESLSGLPRDEILNLLDEGLAAKLVADVPDTLGRFRFSHALVRDTLYDELSAAQRIRLHREAGEALEDSHREHLEPHLAELAHHFVNAAPGGGADKAVEYAQRAAERSVRVLAYEEAVRLFRLALRAYELAPSIDTYTECELLLALGDAQARAGDEADARATFLRAASDARRLGSAELLARAALGYGGRLVWARVGTDHRLVPLLEEALAALPEDDHSVRVRVLARLAGALRDQHEREPRDALSRKAVEMARRLGDPETLAYALDGRFAALLGPENATERLALATELLQLAKSSDEVERATQGHYYRAQSMLELGDIDAVENEVEEAARLTEQLRQPAQLWELAATRATLALFHGRFAEAKQFLEDALVLGEPAQASDAVLSHRVQRFTLCLLAGELENMEASIRRSIVEYPARPMFRCMLATLLAELDRRTEAETLFDELAKDRFALLPRTNEWLFSLGFLADVAGYLEHVEGARELHRLLLPYAALNACTHDYISTGSVARPLGLVARVVGRLDEAEEQFEAALTANGRMRARPWIAWAQLDYAQMLLTRDAAGDGERAAELLGRALDAASELGMRSIKHRATMLAKSENVALEPPGASAAPTSRTTFCREGEYWTIAFEKEAFRLKDSKGLRYLARLLAEPGTELHALDLIAAEHGVAGEQRPVEPGLTVSAPGDAGEILDARAKAEYRRRLAELEEEHEEARAFGDDERAARVVEEHDFLVAELARALGLGGRDRRAASPSERARVSVTRAIRAALARIREHSPELGEHLERTVRTGTFCSYMPDPRVRIDWQL